jgi:transcriptional regulator with XRE-family HTH domain
MSSLSVFPGRLRALRTANKLTLRAVSEQTNIPITHLSRYELGEQTPHLIRALQLAKYYGVSLDYLTGRLNQSVNPEDAALESLLTLYESIEKQDRYMVCESLKNIVKLTSRG